MATTTLSLIRDQQHTLIKALTPTSLASRPFLEYDRRAEFRDWAEESPQSSLRRVFIEEVGEIEPPLASNLDSEELATTLEVTIAYPRDARYGLKEATSANDAMREDMHQIDTAIGHRGSANYVSGQNSAVAQSKEIERGDNVDFVVLRYAVNFRRAM